MNKTLKKTLSIILTVLMIFSVMSVAASAIDAAYEIGYGETLTVTAAAYQSEEGVYVKFVPEKDGRYVLNAESDDLDTFCNLYGSDLEFLQGADDENGIDFSLEYDFIAEETYYFELSTYSDQPEEFKITLVCGHIYEDGVCTGCGTVCHHTETDFLGYCPCGDVFLGVDIADGDELEHDDDAFNNKAGWYRFVPEENGAFCLESFTNPDDVGDAVCELYGANGEWLHVNDDHDESFDFKLIYNFEAGETYYFAVGSYYEDAVFTIKLNRATHTADDGSEHYVEYVAETESNCIEHGYTEGLYCLDCDEYVWGHEEKELSLIHNDFDWDYICNDCDKNLVNNEEPVDPSPDTPDEPADDICKHENITDGKCDICGIEVTFITIEMTDSYGDGWNGNEIIIEQLVDGEYKRIAAATIESGDTNTYSAFFSADDIYTFKWKMGSYPEECRFTITVDGETICETADASELSDGQMLYVNCEHKKVTDCKCDVCCSELHDWSNKDGICANGCDYSCPHESYTEGGVCKVCGYECTHNWNGDIVCDICGCYCEHSATENGVCTKCEYILPFLLTTGENVTYHGSFPDAFDKAQDGSIIKLLKDYDDYNNIEINKAITLDLNGKEWIQPSSGAFDVTANATFTDSVGGGYLGYGLSLYSPVTFSGGSYKYIGIHHETDDTIGDYLADCYACFDHYTDELIDTADKEYVLGVTIKLSHNLGEQTCKGYPCEDCGEYFGEADPDAHVWKHGECIICEYVCEHSFSNYTETKAPTCTEEGQKIAPCDYCDAVDAKAIPELNHKDTLVQVEAKAKTCTEAGFDAYEYCTACDYSTYVEIPASHEIKTVDKKDAACTEAGHEAYEYCTECDYTTYKEIPSNGHTPLEAVKENEVAPECEKAGSYDLVVYCDVCGEELARDTVAVDALTHTDADGDYKCDNGCGHEFEKPVDPTPDTPDEPTDDTCDHLCHKDGILGFLWKIISFFYRLFNIQQYCDCGVIHYDAPVFG